MENSSQKNEMRSQEEPQTSSPAQRAAPKDLSSVPTAAFTDEEGRQDETLSLSILEELDLQFGAAKNKSQIIRALEHSNVLHRIPCSMMSPTIVTTEQAKKDFKRERVLLNDVPFIPDKIDIDRCHAFAFTLQMLLKRLLCRASDSSRLNIADITDLIMQRACRTSAGADSFFMVQKMLCVEGTFVTQRAFLNDPPVKLDIFLTSDRESGNFSTETSFDDARAGGAAAGRVENIVTHRESGSSDSLSHGIAMESSAVNRSEAMKWRSSADHPLLHHAIDEKLKNASTPPKKRTLFGHPHPLYKKQHDIGSNFGRIDSAMGPSSENVKLGISNLSHSHSIVSTSQSSINTGNVMEYSAGAGTSLCARSQVINSFAIYDVSAIEDVTGVAADDPAPWLEVEAIVFDESNFRSGKHWRKMQLIVTCPETGEVYTSSSSTASGAAANYRSSGRLSGRMILQELSSWFHYSHGVNSSGSGSMWQKQSASSPVQQQMLRSGERSRNDKMAHMEVDLQQSKDAVNEIEGNTCSSSRGRKQPSSPFGGKFEKISKLPGLSRHTAKLNRDNVNSDSTELQQECSVVGADERLNDRMSNNYTLSDGNTSQSSDLPPATGASMRSSVDAGESTNTSYSKSSIRKCAEGTYRSTAILLDSDDDSYSEEDDIHQDDSRVNREKAQEPYSIGISLRSMKKRPSTSGVGSSTAASSSTGGDNSDSRKDVMDTDGMG